MQKSIKLFPFLIFSLLACLSWGQVQIEDLVQKAIEQNYQLQANNYQILRAQSLNTRGVAGNLPRISLSGNARTDINNIRLQFFDNREVNQNNADNYSAGTNLDIEYPIYEGGAKRARRLQLKIDAQLSEINYQTRKEELLRELFNRLADYQLHERQIKVYALDTLYWSEILELRKEMKSLGRGDKTDIIQIEAELNNSRIQLQRAEQSSILARIQIESLTFLDPSKDINLEGLRSFLQSKMVSPLDLGPAIIRESELQVQRTNTLLSLSESALYPTLSLFAGYGFNWSRNAVGVLLSNQNFGPYGGISLNWTLYDGRRLQREKEAAKLDMLSREQTLKQQTRDLDYAKRQFQTAIETETAVYQNENKQQEILRRQYEVFEQQYRQGETDLLEVLNYRRQYRLSQLNANIAEFQLAQYLIEWLYFDGQLRQF